MAQQTPATAQTSAFSETARVIFINPEEWVIEHYLTILSRAEYKCITITGQKHLMAAIDNYPGSILFFNIDKNPKETSWYAIASSAEKKMEENHVLPIFIGKQTRDSIKASVNLNISFDAFDMGKGVQQTLLLIRAVLKQWYPKTKRRYIRVRCKNQGRTTFNIRMDGESYNGEILDISSAGMACRFDGGREPINVKRGTVLQKIQLKLNSRLVMVDAVVMGSRENEGRLTYVLLFQNHVDTGGIQKIKDYVMERLQEEFDEQVVYGS